MGIEDIKQKVNNALNKLYEREAYLFEHDLCERCIQHKFANYLEQENFNGFFIDCEYNRAYSKSNGGIKTKKITSEDGNSVDIVITKRNDDPNDDLVCFELKKWNSSKGEEGFKSDRLKLEILTGQKLPANTKNGDILKDRYGDYYCFNYKYGFFIIFGQTRDQVKIEILTKKFMKSKIIKSKRLIDRIVEVIEHEDDFGKILTYSVVIAIHGKNTVGSGAGKLEESNFSNIKKAIKFFNNQN